MSRNTIYTKTFKKETWTWKLEFIPASNEPLPGTEVTYEINSDGLNVVSPLEIEFNDKLPCGVATVDTLEIEFDLRFLPDDLIEYISTPYYANGGTLEINMYGNGSNYYDRNFDTLNVVCLWTDKGLGGDLDYLYFVGGQKRTLEGETTLEPEGIPDKSTYISLLKLSQEMVSAEDVMYFMAGQAYGGQIEYFRDTKHFDIVTGNGTYKKFDQGFNYDFYNKADERSGYLYAIWFKLLDLENAIHEITGKIFTILVRAVTGSNYWYDNSKHSLTHWNLYSIDMAVIGYNNRYGRLAKLDDDEIWFLAFKNFTYDSADFTIFNTQTLQYPQVGGFLIKEKDSVSLWDYDTIWDYWTAITESHFAKMYRTYNSDGLRKISVYLGPVFDPVLSETRLYLKDNIEEKNTFTRGKNIIKEGVANVKGLGSKDTNEYRSGVNPGSMSDSDFTFKTVFHTCCPQVNLEDKDILGQYKAFGFNCDNNGMNSSLLFYKATLPGDTQERMIKVFNGVDIYDGKAWHNMQYTYYDFQTDLDTDIQILLYANGIKGLNNSMNSAKTVAEIVATTFGKFKQHEYAYKQKFNDDLNINTSGNIYIIDEDISYLPYYSKLTAGQKINIISRINSATDLGIAMNVSMDLDKEIVESTIMMPGD